MKPALVLSDNDFSLFQQLLVEESGLYFDKERSDSLHLALWERLQKRKYDSYQEYYNLLKFHTEGRLEIRELLDLITIGETYFFRNLPQFDALIKFVLPEIIQKKMYSADKSIRIWSAGCSKGDEAYSIAIAIMEVLPSYENWNISILGTDVNRDALISAKEAIYNKKDVGHLPTEYLTRYFEKRGTNYILKDSVRRLARFKYHNLAKDPFTLEGMENLDIVFCRNVTIYFDFNTTKRVIESFYNNIVRDGYLFIGHAETLWQITNKFETIEFPQTFLYKKVLYPVEVVDLKPFIGVPEITLEKLTPIEEELDEEVFTKKIEPEEIENKAEETAKAVKEVKKPSEEIKKRSETKVDNIETMYQEGAKLFAGKEYDEAIVLFDKIITQDKNYIRAYFAKATILANQAKYKDAVNLLEKIIETDNLYIEAYYLLGVLSYKTGDFKEAEEQFKKVIYIDSNIILAYFNLGNIYLYQRRFAMASREFNNAIKLLEKHPKDEEIKFCEDFTVEFLLRACNNNLEEISPKR